MTPHRYFTRQDARNLLGVRVVARVVISRLMLRTMGLWVAAGTRGTVTQIASGPCPEIYLVGIAWQDLRPLVPRRNSYPIDWYTEEEFHALIGGWVEAA